MNYLNQSGANVRNHMSTIEDNLVEQARHDFPAIPKKPRIGISTVSTPVKQVKTESITPASTVQPTQPRSTKSANNIVKSAQPATSPTHTAEEYPKRTDQRAVVTGERRNLPQSHQPAGAIHNTASRSGTSRPLPRTTPSDSVGQERYSGSDRLPVRSQQQPGTRSQQQPGTRSQQQPGTRSQQQPGTRSQQQPGTRSQQQPGTRPQQQPGTRPQHQQSTRSNPQSNQARPQPQQGGTWKGNHRSNRSQQSGFNHGGQGRSGSMMRRPVLQKPKGPATNVKSVQLPAQMTVKDFAQLVELASGDIIKKLMGLGVMATINQEIDLDTMTLIAEEFGIKATAALTEEEKVQVEEIEDDPATLVKRSPVVTIMGHVDHGKTSLLDAIRKTHVTAQEAGGITQHIGAYQVELKERKITFLDTPGHAAFTAMRARGAQVTDIAVLVVAADDGVMPQTVEAINHAKDANVSIIVAINKIDKPGANPDRVKQELTEYGLVAEEWGGDTVFALVSAKQRVGIENLLEMILLVADLKELKANPNRSAKGTIIEAELDKGRGPVATVLVQNGTLELGNSIIAGAAFGKVRALINDKGKRVKKAGPSTPVEMIGFDELPEAGDILYAITDDRLARQLADKRMQLKRESELLQNQKVTLADLFSKIKEGEIKELKLIVKADVQGSIEAIRQSLERLSNEEVKVKVIHGGVGAITEGDVTFAAAANAIVIGFNVRPDLNAKRMAERENVDIQLYRVIYNIIEDVQKAMEGMLDPEFNEVISGRAEVRMVYKVPKVGNIAGCYIVEGKINRNNEIRLLRDNIVIHEGKIESLKRFKDDIREVAEGFECGVGIANFNDIKEGDIIEAFLMEEIKRK
jgi:translation initiation factor IF-2